MARVKYEALTDLRTKCGRLVYPKGAIVDLPEKHNHTKRWLKMNRLKVVNDGCQQVHDDSRLAKVGN